MRYPVDDWPKWYSAQGFGVKTEYGFHEGEDLNLKTGGNSDLGQPIYAIADGEVTSVHDHTTGFGKHIHIKHEGKWGTVWCHYAHCQEIFVKVGDKVKEGQKVTTVGFSGSLVSHLHWAIKLLPTGIDAIAKTKEDLDKWTAPIEFVKKWMVETAGAELKECLHLLHEVVIPEKEGLEREYKEFKEKSAAEIKSRDEKILELEQKIKQTETDRDQSREELKKLKEEDYQRVQSLSQKLLSRPDWPGIISEIDKLLTVEDQKRGVEKELRGCKVLVGELERCVTPVKTTASTKFSAPALILKPMDFLRRWLIRKKH